MDTAKASNNNEKEEEQQQAVMSDTGKMLIERLRLIRRENEQYMYELDRIERETEKLRICNDHWKARAQRSESSAAELQEEREGLKREKFRLEQEARELREAIAERAHLQPPSEGERIPEPHGLPMCHTEYLRTLEEELNSVPMDEFAMGDLVFMQDLMHKHMERAHRKRREKDVEAQAILEQHEKSKLCIVCMDRNKETCLQPCRHKAMCETCSAAVTRCPVCRTPIEEVVKLIDA